MGTLLGSLSTALSAIQADQTAVQVTTNNIANANTTGYDRQVPILEESSPVDIDGLVLGSGVTVASVQSMRDNVLNLRLNSETQQQSSLNTYVSGMQQVEAIFNEASGTGLSSAIDGFFSSLQALLLIPMKVIGDSDWVPVTGSEMKLIVFGAKRRWRSYRA
jgi:flagellar hook-associated protein 1